ncbi:MAG: Rrf2 family transcriptional regulator [Halanaerobiales bacterium]|nr:Rrf2 family transcriptional regulator [Halanaerobiales bacterium]
MAYPLAFSQGIMIIVYIYIKTELGKLDYLSQRKISAALNIPVPTISKVIRSLINANILKSKAGKNGGFMVQQEPADLTLYDVFTALEQRKPLFKSDFNINLEGEKVGAITAEINNSLNCAEQAMKAELKNRTIKELIDIYLK